jgi:hypothetical protein
MRPPVGPGKWGLSVSGGQCWSMLVKCGQVSEGQRCLKMGYMKKGDFSPVLMSDSEVWIDSVRKRDSMSNPSVEGLLEQGGGIARAKGLF